MPALPAAATKNHLDAATDDPKQARTELADLVDKVNSIRDYLSTLLGSDGTAATARTNLDVPQNFPSGTEMIFGDSTLPTGWTHNTARNDEVVRIVSGAGNTSGGSKSINGGTMPSIVAVALTEAQMPAHNHGVGVENSGADAAGSGTVTRHTGNTNTTSKGSGSTHSHSGGSYDIKYRDYVSATKN